MRVKFLHDIVHHLVRQRIDVERIDIGGLHELQQLVHFRLRLLIEAPVLIDKTLRIRLVADSVPDKESHQQEYNRKGRKYVFFHSKLY